MLKRCTARDTSYCSSSVRSSSPSPVAHHLQRAAARATAASFLRTTASVRQQPNRSLLCSCSSSGLAAAAAPSPAMAAAEQPPLLDRAAFTQELPILALRVPKQRCNEIVKSLRGHLLDRAKIPAVLQEPGQPADAPTRLVRLSDTITADSLPAPVQALVGPLSEGKCELLPCSLTLEYSHLTGEQVLRKLLPAGVDPPNSFEQVGHIAHLNLKESQLPHKLLIGQVLVDKNPAIKTVINKVGAIETEFRVFTMELLAGEPRTETEVVQHGLRFRLDFAQVYWNSRLEMEHKRLVDRYFRPGEVVVDMMAGIGPFAVPAAIQGCQVYANDLNPASTRYMAANVKLNNVRKRVHVFNMDARAFLRLLCRAPPMPSSAQADGANANANPQAEAQQQQGDGDGALPPPATDSATAAAPQQQQQAPQQGREVIKPGMILSKAGGPSQPSMWDLQDVPPTPVGFEPPVGGLLFEHAVMNLPASAIEFLDAFNGAFDPATWQGRQLPLVHVYTFKPANMTQEAVLERAQHYLGGPFDEEPTVHQVRDVAPNKLMLCITFRVPKAVAFNGRAAAPAAGAPGEEGGEGDGHHSKRQRVDG